MATSPAPRAAGPRIATVATCGLWPLLSRSLLKAAGSLATSALSGVPVTIGRISLWLDRSGMLTVGVQGLRIGSPVGFKSEMAKIDSVSVVVNLVAALKSFCSCSKPRQVDVVSVVCDGCHFKIEKDSLTTSNFSVFLDKLNKQEAAVEKEQEEEEKAEEREQNHTPVLHKAATKVMHHANTTMDVTTNTAGYILSAPMKMFSSEPHHHKDDTQVALHHVQVRGLSVTWVTRLTLDEEKEGHSVHVADIEISDFSKDAGAGDLAMGVRKLCIKIMTCLASNVGSLAQAGVQTIPGATAQAVEGAWGFFTNLFDWS